MAGRASAAAAALALALAGWGCLEVRERVDGGDAPLEPCVTCHGTADRSGPVENWPAPPVDLEGHSEKTRPGVGAHQLHLIGWATHGPIACRECHRVPNAIDTLGHTDSARPAEFAPGELARQGDRSPAYDPVERTCADTYCHGSARPIWTHPRDSLTACGSCHGLPPEPPHVQQDACVLCHASVVDDEQRIIAPSLHVDGEVQIELPGG